MKVCTDRFRIIYCSYEAEYGQSGFIKCEQCIVEVGYSRRRLHE